MTKLAFTSLFFFTLLSMITAAPVFEVQTSIKNGRMPYAYEQDGLVRQGHNQMDRGRSITMNFDELTAGNPLENGSREASKPTALSKEDAMDDVVHKLVCYCNIATDEKAKEIVNEAYDRLPEDKQEALLSEDEDEYMDALDNLLELYHAYH